MKTLQGRGLPLPPNTVPRRGRDKPLPCDKKGRRMNAMSRRGWKIEMTGSERRRGLVFFLLYLLFFPRANAWLQQLWMGDGEVLVAEANVLYYAFLFVLCLFIFWDFLKKDLLGLLDWLPENLFAAAVGLLLSGGLYAVLSLLPFPVRDPISLQYAQEFQAAPAPTLALILLLIPLVEETVYRGLIYGSLRPYSRTLAMGFCALLYALAQVWRYALELSDPRYLLLGLLYLPMSAALTWCYDRGGSVWSCMVLHGGLNGVILATAL